MKTFIFSTAISIGMYGVAWALLLGVIKPKEMSRKLFTEMRNAFLSASENMVMLK